MLSPQYKPAASREQEAGEWVDRLCRAVRESLGADRVIAWLYDARAQTVSPFATGEPGGPGMDDLLARWSGLPLERSAAACTVLLESRPVEIGDAQNDERLPAELAADLALGSVRFEPLIAERPVGMLSIEPAPAGAEARMYPLLPIVAAGLARIASGREAERAREEAEFLLELSEATVSAESLDGILAVLCERTASRAGARGASVFLWTDGRLEPRMTRLASGARDPAAWRAFTGAGEPLPAAEAAVQSGRAVTVAEPGSPLLGAHWSEALGIGSAIAAPIGREQNVIGALVIDDSEPGTFSADDARLAAEAAARIAPAIEQALAGEESSVHIRAAGAVRRLLQEGSGAISVGEAGEVLARVARDAVGAQRATVLLKQDGDRIGHLVTVGDDGDFGAALKEALAGRPAAELTVWEATVRDPKPLFVENASASRLLPAALVERLALQSYAAMPLLSGAGPLGIVLLSHSSEPRRWEEDSREVVSQLVLEGSLVVENAALRAAEHARIDRLSEQAFHDHLTGLPNRALFLDRLEHAFARMGRRKRSVAVLFLDLDGFKPINDSYGHEEGDRLLVAVSGRLQACLRPEDTVARLGGDEFTVLLEDIQDARFVIQVAERIAESLKAPFHLNGHEASITASIGIAVSTGLETTPGDLLRSSDQAMYEAKRAGKARFVVFDGQLPAPPPGKERLEDSDPEGGGSAPVEGGSVPVEGENGAGAESDGGGPETNGPGAPPQAEADEAAEEKVVEEAEKQVVGEKVVGEAEKQVAEEAEEVSDAEAEIRTALTEARRRRRLRFPPR